MTREFVMGKVDRDLACAIALSVVEFAGIVTLDAVTIHDCQLQPVGTQRDWLGTDDPLDVVTRDYLLAWQEAMAGNAKRPAAAWSAAGAVKTREGALQRAKQARLRGRGLLAERGVLESARAAGFTVFG
jgi:hypothetical protein